MNYWQADDLQSRIRHSAERLEIQANTLRKTVMPTDELRARMHSMADTLQHSYYAVMGVEAILEGLKKSLEGA